MKSNLSNEEKYVLELTSEIWNSWCKLPNRSDDDNNEFQRAIHLAQQLIALRIARRVDPDIWRQPENIS